MQVKKIACLTFSSFLACGSTAWTFDSVDPNPTPPGYVQGGGPSGFQLRDLPNAPPVKPDTKHPAIEIPELEGRYSPIGDVAPPDTPTVPYPGFWKPPVLTDRPCSDDTDCASGLKCRQVAFKPPDQWTTQCALLPDIVYPPGTHPIPEGTDSVDYPDFRIGGTLPAGFSKIHSLKAGELPPAPQGYEWVYAPESGCDLDRLCGMLHSCTVDDHPERLPSDWFQSYVLKPEDFYCLQYRSRGLVSPLEGSSLAGWASRCASSSRTTILVDPSLRGARLLGNGLMALDSKNYLCNGFVELLRQQGITIIKDGDVYRVVKGTANAAVPGAPPREATSTRLQKDR